MGGAYSIFSEPINKTVSDVTNTVLDKSANVLNKDVKEKTSVRKKEIQTGEVIWKPETSLKWGKNFGDTPLKDIKELKAGYYKVGYHIPAGDYFIPTGSTLYVFPTEFDAVDTTNSTNYTTTKMAKKVDSSEADKKSFVSKEQDFAKLSEGQYILVEGDKVIPRANRKANFRNPKTFTAETFYEAGKDFPADKEFKFIGREGSKVNVNFYNSINDSANVVNVEEQVYLKFKTGQLVELKKAIMVDTTAK